MRTRLWISLACIAGAVVLARAIPVDPCPYTGKSIRYQRPFTTCIDNPGTCVLWSPNYGYTWTCDFWCCYDNNGNCIGKPVGDCYGDCNPKRGLLQQPR